MAVDIFNYTADANPNNIINSDPTVLRSVGTFISGSATLVIATTGEIIYFARWVGWHIDPPINIQQPTPTPWVTKNQTPLPHTPNMARLAAKRAAEDAARTQSENQ